MERTHKKRKKNTNRVTGRGQIFLQFSVMLLALGMNWSGLFAIGETISYYFDEETSSENAFNAGSLDFSLGADEWDPVDTAGALLPGDTITRHMSVFEGDSISFQYKIKTVKTAGDDAFCDALDLVAKREAVTLYDGALIDFDLTPPVEIEGDGQDDWTFEVTLPGDSSPFDEESCEFRFDADGWQIGFPDGSGGFSDSEALENILESGVAETEDGLDNISPIADSYVDEDHSSDNHGNDHDLKVRSQSGGKNKRSFIRFDFHFPSGTAIQSAVLKLFLDDAPSSSRTYALARSLSSWIENDITWDNQPATSSPPTASAVTGIVNDVWLSWDVTDDVANFVSEIFSNDGWGLFDTVESSATSREGKFSAREEDHEDERPVLEVAFSAPPAPTTHLVVNEVYYDVGSGMGSEGTNEWVELYNPTDAAVDVKDWQICDASSCDTFATTSPSILIPSHEFAVITPNISTWTHWAIPADAVKIVIGSNIGGGLADAGDAVVLKNASSVEIDAMSYGTNTTKLDPSVPDAPDGNSVARVVKGYDADLADDWIINATPNPGTNPSDSGIEIMRFRSEGVEVADYTAGLDPLSVGDPSPANENIGQEGDLIGDFFALFYDSDPENGVTLFPQDEEGSENEPAPAEESGTVETQTTDGTPASDEVNEESGEVIAPTIFEEEIIITPEETAVTEETLPTEEPAEEIVTEEAILPVENNNEAIAEETSAEGENTTEEGNAIVVEETAEEVTQDEVGEEEESATIEVPVDGSEDGLSSLNPAKEPEEIPEPAKEPEPASEPQEEIIDNQE